MLEYWTGEAFRLRQILKSPGVDHAGAGSTRDPQTIAVPRIESDGFAFWNAEA